MTYFKGARKVERITLKDPNYWVEMHTEVKWAEGKNFITPGSDGKPSIKAGVSDFLASLIVDWNLDDEKGEKAPITPEFIDQLDSADAMTLVAATGNQVEEKAQEKKS